MLGTNDIISYRQEFRTPDEIRQILLGQGITHGEAIAIELAVDKYQFYGFGNDDDSAAKMKIGAGILFSSQKIIGIPLNS